MMHRLQHLLGYDWRVVYDHLERDGNALLIDYRMQEFRFIAAKRGDGWSLWRRSGGFIADNLDAYGLWDALEQAIK